MAVGGTRMATRWIAALAAVVLIVAGCAGGTSEDATDGSGGELQATRWVLSSYAVRGRADRRPGRPVRGCPVHREPGQGLRRLQRLRRRLSDRRPHAPGQHAGPDPGLLLRGRERLRADLHVAPPGESLVQRPRRHADDPWSRARDPADVRCRAAQPAPRVVGRGLVPGRHRRRDRSRSRTRSSRPCSASRRSPARLAATHTRVRTRPTRRSPRSGRWRRPGWPAPRT